MYHRIMVSIHSNAYRVFLHRLKKARHDADLTQRQVSEALGVQQSFVSKSESGERRVDIIELAAFAKLYKKPLDFFITR